MAKKSWKWTEPKFGGAKVGKSPNKLPVTGQRSQSVTINKRSLPTRKA